MWKKFLIYKNITKNYQRTTWNYSNINDKQWANSGLCKPKACIYSINLTNLGYFEQLLIY
jgi:hypothetical protein